MRNVNQYTSTPGEATCCNCAQGGSELCVIPCHCSFHTKCFPVSHLANYSQKNRTGPLQCPGCGSKDMKGIRIIPVDVNSHYYGKSIPVGAPKIPSSDTGNSSNAMSPFLEEFYLSLAPIFLFENGQSNYTNINIAEEVEIRNGRWTPEEVQFIECLINLFKEGNLPVSTGVTLNNFLRSMFLCKSTRLRKKIKNANFCTSTFLLRTNDRQQMCAVELSKLQEQFLSSLDDKKNRNLLRLGMRRMWSTYFFNLCLHLGYDAVIAQDWLTSLEDVEEKVNAAKESKKMRERRNRSSSVRKYSDISNHHQMGLNRSNHSHQQLGLDNSRHSYQRPLTLSASNHRPLNLDGSNHSHGSIFLVNPPSNLSYALEQADKNPQTNINRPVPVLSSQVTGLDTSNHSNGLGLGRLALNSYPHRPMMTPLPPRRYGSLPSDIRDNAGSGSPPKTLPSVSRVDSKSSLWGKGVPREPEMVPLVIEGDKEDSGNFSDVSDSESQQQTSTKGVDFAPIDTLIQEPRSSKRLRVEEIVEKNNPFLDEVIEEVSTDDLCDVADVCEQFGNWSPFVQKMSDFVEKEDLPFEYFDVWMVTNKTKEQRGEDSNAQGPSSDLVLQHVGHSARSDGSIWTLYHMNEFGKLSSNFCFPPGIGLPGRVLSSGQPLWDDSIPESSQMKFPRVEGAKTHGIKKGVGIPLYHTSFGKVVIALYSTQERTQNIGLVQKCCQLFQGSQVGKMGAILLNHADSDGGSSSKNFAAIVSEEAHASDDKCEQDIIDLLARHAVVNGVSSSAFSESHTSLRLLLLRPSSYRTLAQNESIGVLKKSYKNYKETERPENDIATLLVHEWKFLNDMQPQTPSEQDGVLGDKQDREKKEPFITVSPSMRVMSPSVSMDHMKY